MKPMRYLALTIMACALIAAAPADDIGAMVGRADELMKDTVRSLNAAGEYSSMDRQVACQQARRAQSDLTELGTTVDAISAAMRTDPSMTDSDRASWSDMAAKMTDFVYRRRETAMDAWQKLC